VLTTTDQALEFARTLRDRLRPVFGERLRGVVLYGSRARGDAAPDSDFDFLVLLDQVESFGAEQERLSAVVCDLSLEYDIVVSALPSSETTFAESGLPLYRNARREGLVIR